MFVDQLSVEEKKCLVQLFTFIVRSDGKTAKQELRFLHRFADDNGLTVNINQEVALNDACDGLKTLSAKTIAIQQVVKMALFDDIYNDEHQLRAKLIANELGFSESKFKAIEHWAIEGFHWFKRGQDMIVEAQ